MHKERMKPCSGHDLVVGDIFIKNARSREAFIVTNVLDDTISIQSRKVFQLHSTPFKKNNTVIFLTHESTNTSNHEK